jgi:CDP-glycerol glycerophosphotransferase (TagB/SpsB family)
MASSMKRDSIGGLSSNGIRLQHGLHIAFLLTHGFSARMIIRSGIAKRILNQGIGVTAIAPNAEEAYFQEECHAEGIMLQQAPSITDRLGRRLKAYRAYFLADVMNNPALKAGHGFRFEKNPLLGFIMAAINRTIARRQLFRRFIRAIILQVSRSEKIKQLLDKMRPDLLVVPNPFGEQETAWTLHARELGIPIICQLLSWDNITAKGTPLLMPDYFISWGPIMTAEMVNLYHFPKEKIYECGVPHFDVYSRNDELTPRSVLLKELNLPENHQYILYGMVTRMYCPNELEILAWLADRINKKAFARPCSLIIRPHPQLISGIYSMNSRESERLKALVSPRVALDVPHVLSEQLAWDLPKKDMHHLASVLAGCAMCLNASSTLSLDACMLDRPVINIAFDGWEELPYERSARQSLDYLHMAKLLALGGIRIARSFSELESHINAYLCDPSLDHEGRMVSVAQECGPRDGRAAERVAATLVKLALEGRK